jgi:ArsR family transcriptional regulator
METSETPDLARAARWFHALADPTRLRILGRLTDGEQCVGDLSRALAARQSRLSFHLKTLKEAGLVGDRRQGRWVFYALNPEVVEEMEDRVRALRTGLRQSLESI